MIKKISALLLALVLCVTAVVMPVSALESGKTVGYRIELDADSYTAGSKVTVKLYMEFAEDKEWGAGSVIFGMSDVFVESQGATSTSYMIDEIKSTVTHNDVFTSTYKTPAENATWAWVTASTIVNNCINNSSEATYEKFLKLTVAKNTGGSHEYAGSTKNGLTGAELNADTEPYVSFQLTLAEDLAAGTEILVGIPSGSLQGSYSYMQYYTNPGSSTAGTKIKAADCDLTQAVATATVGAATIVNPLKGQMRYGATAGTYDVRALAVITGADFTATFGSIADAKTKIKDIGFVFASGSNITAPSMEAVAALVENGTAITGYKKVPISQISTAISTGNYVFSCIVTDIPAEAAQSDKLIAIGYVAWDSDADGVVDSYNYYTEAQTINFADYYKA